MANKSPYRTAPIDRSTRAPTHPIGRAVVLVLGACLALIGGCEVAPDTTGPVAGRHWQLPSTGISPAAPWARKSCKIGVPAPDQLACVAGVAVTRADFDRVRSAYPAHISNRDVVHALVRAEVLAQKAQKDGLWARWLIRPYKRALVRRLLRIEFEEKYTAKQVKAADIDRAWRRSPIRVRYSHAKGWWVTDAQLLCCQGDWRRCKIDPTAQACITKLQPMAYELYGKLTANPPKTPEHMCGRVRNMTGEFPSVTCNDISYFYDDSKPYDQQGDYDLMLESYVLGVAKIKPGTIGEPIRTPHGWHIVRLDRIEPALDGKLTDPKVRADIAQGILTGVRIRDVQIRAIDLLRANNVAIFYDNLSKRLIGGGKKKVDKPTSSPK